MGLGALAVKDWSLDLRIQPVGIYYADRDRYRSNLFAWRGDPISFDHLRDLYEQSPSRRRKGLPKKSARP